VVCDNEFEKMPKVIPPNELGVTFDDIRVLDNAKETLHELVMLPLQWPELFLKGPLTKVFSDQGRHYSEFGLSSLKEGEISVYPGGICIGDFMHICKLGSFA